MTRSNSRLRQRSRTNPASRAIPTFLRLAEHFDTKLAVQLLLTLFLILLAGCDGPSPEANEVVVYASQDQVYAEPLLAEFGKRTGIRVKAVYDSEMVKTVGLVNRLLAEQNHPQCDLFWNNEALRTYQLAGKGLLRSIEGLAEFGYRSRRLVINTNRLELAQAPATFRELTNRVWSGGKLALAYPVFGTTATHFQALRQNWGESNWLVWCQALAANQPRVVDGNSTVVRLVSRGEVLIGLTDSDDIAAGLRSGEPIMALPLMEDSLLIPNTVGVLAAAPHPKQAQQLFEYLQSPRVLEALIRAAAVEGADRTKVSQPTLPVRWPDLVTDLSSATKSLETIFLR